MAPNPLSRLKNPFATNTPATQPEGFGQGNTTTAVDPATVPPRVDQLPYGASGRANFWGLPQWDETNAKLVGPAGQLLLDNMYRTDPDIRRLILMVSTPIMAGSWSLEPYGGDNATDEDKDIADAIWWALTSFMSPDLVAHLAEAVPLVARAGYAPFEQIWTTTPYDYVPHDTAAERQQNAPPPPPAPGALPAPTTPAAPSKLPGDMPSKTITLTVPKTLQVRLPRSIWKWYQDDYGALTFIGQILPNRSMVTIPADELVYYRLGGEGDNWMGVSMLRGAYKPWSYKDRLERIDAIGQERKAVGVPIVYPPQNASKDQRDAMEQILASLHTNEVAYVVMPGPKQGLTGMENGEGWLVDVITFDSSSGDSIQNSLTYHKLAIAGSVLGDFMELGHHQVGARATAQVQMDPFITAEDAFARVAIIPPLAKLIDRIRTINWPDAKGSPKLVLNLTDAASLSELSGFVQQCVAAGVMQADPELEDFLRERADLPPANPDIRAQKQATASAQQQAQIDGFQNPTGPNGPAFQQPQPGDSSGSGGGKQFEQLALHTHTLDTPSAKWWESLLSQKKLKTAFDGARQSVETAGLDATRPIAHSIARGAAVNPDDVVSLTNALNGEYERLYTLGHQTVRMELAKQRKELMTPSDVASAVGARFTRARQRAETSAGNIVHDIRRRLGQQQVTGLKGPQLSAAALEAARASLHLEALDNAGAMVNDGRYDAAQADPDVVGAYYTAVLDGTTCDECAADDSGIMLSADEASLLGPPNPMCEGGDRCRCVLVWVLSSDPTAVQSITG